MSDFAATYSPDDNKLRLYAARRLEPELYARVKAAGFKWAPKQDLFFATWTPAREDLALELAGEVDDEDTSLVDRAEERAERFKGYSDNRARDAKQATEAVRQIADGIPFGQPILVGHHSEKRARKDAEKIERGLQRSVSAWRTSEYWTDRAAGAIRHAKYKERPDVRARRIKTLEAEKRKSERAREEGETWRKLWATLSVKRKDGEASTFLDRVLYVARAGHGMSYEMQAQLRDGTITPEEAQARVLAGYASSIAHAERWIEHYTNRLAYERALLEDAGGTVADQTSPEKGGACRCWCGPSYGKGWSYIQKVNKVSVTVLDNYTTADRRFTRTIPFDKLHAIMTATEVKQARAEGRIIEAEHGIGFYLHETAPAPQPSPKPQRETPPEIGAMRDCLRAGVQVVSAPQLFPTPRDLARRMCEIADINAGHRVLEPSAGTGELLRAAIDRALGFDCGVRVVAVEVNAQLVAQLEEMRQRRLYATDANFDIRQSDFLQCNGDLGTFDRIVMNPPFKDGEDIKHIEHARTFLKPGGRLVAICANGPRQRERLRSIAAEWVDLPPGSFKAAGTMVAAAVVVIDAPAAPKPEALPPRGPVQQEMGIRSGHIGSLPGQLDLLD